ncbi:MAG: hypothetical protein FJ304_22755 [Planctomycetes bacterium]|nr:hypothetical protein [Planctomycetota bacterium]
MNNSEHDPALRTEGTYGWTVLSALAGAAALVVASIQLALGDGLAKSEPPAAPASAPAPATHTIPPAPVAARDPTPVAAPVAVKTATPSGPTIDRIRAKNDEAEAFLKQLNGP